MDPKRLLPHLLSGEQLQSQLPGQFLYLPRPLKLPGITIAPQVCFRAVWQTSFLGISLIEYRLPGLPSLERIACYRFIAELHAVEGAFLIRANASLTLDIGGVGLSLPLQFLNFLGDRALALIFNRLEQRCITNLRVLPQ